MRVSRVRCDWDGIGESSDRVNIIWPAAGLHDRRAQALPGGSPSRNCHRQARLGADGLSLQLHEKFHERGVQLAPPPALLRRRHPWPPAGDYFYSEAIATSFPWLKAEPFCLTERQWSVKQQASRIFSPTLGVEYVQSTMKKDEVLWRL